MVDGTRGGDPIEALLEQGIEIPDDPIELEALLEGQGEAEAEPEGGEGEQAGDGTGEGEGQQSAAGEGGEPAADSQDEPGDKPDESQQDAGPPQAVLRETRRSLHEAQNQLSERDQQLAEERQKREELERRLADVEAQGKDAQQHLQKQADEVTGDGSVQLEGLTDEDLEALAADQPDEVVDALRKLKAQNDALQAKVDEAQRFSEQARQEREEVERDQLQADIDAVPLLSVIEAATGEEADALWKRAIEYDNVLKSDPDFRGAPRRERFAEVGKRMERHLGKDGVAKWLGEKPAQGSGKSTDQIVDEKLDRAREGASPDSLSDLPAGSPGATSDVDRLESMDVLALEEAMEKAADAGRLEEFMERMQTVER